MGKGGIAARFISRRARVVTITLLGRTGLSKGLVKPPKMDRAKVMLIIYSEKNLQNRYKDPPITPISKNPLLAIEDTIIR